MKFKYIVQILLAIIGVFSHQSYAQESSKLQDSLALELCQIYGADQTIRRVGNVYQDELIQKIDSSNFYKVVDFIDRYGLPNEELLGDVCNSNECVKGAIICVLLHTPHMIVNDTTYFNFFSKLLKDGEIPEITLLTILDKYYWAKGEILYGSQFGMPSIENRGKTNMARQRVGACPLPDSLFIGYVK